MDDVVGRDEKADLGIDRWKDEGLVDLQQVVLAFTLVGVVDRFLRCGEVGEEDDTFSPESSRYSYFHFHW